MSRHFDIGEFWVSSLSGISWSASSCRRGTIGQCSTGMGRGGKYSFMLPQRKRSLLKARKDEKVYWVIDTAGEGATTENSGGNTLKVHDGLECFFDRGQTSFPTCLKLCPTLLHFAPAKALPPHPVLLVLLPRALQCGPPVLFLFSPVFRTWLCPSCHRSCD